jgi:lambda family phage portal protein
VARATWLDRAIGWASPERAAKRIKARGEIDMMTRDYAGAAAGRHTANWRAPSTSADAEIWKGGRRLRDRSRDLERNNPFAAKAVSLLAGHIVGEGIMPRFKDEKIRRAFDKWAKTCDADGQLDFYGLQSLHVRGMVSGGEMLSRRRWRRSGDGFAIPVQIQSLEPDYLDDSRHGITPDGRKIVQGIEFDQIGRRAAYWLYRDHPGNSFVFPMTLTTRVPASEVTHLYEKQRTQARGVPWAAPVIRRIRDVDDYDFAEGIRKKIEASVTAFVIGDDDDMALSPNGEEGSTPQGSRAVDSAGNPIDKIAPGLIAHLRGTKDVKFNHPANVGGYEEYKRVSAREIAAGLRVPYALMTGDGSDQNFSMQRTLITEFRRFCSVIQWQIVVPMLLDPWVSWFAEAAFAAGEIDSPEFEYEWSMPRVPSLEPYRDAMAMLITMRTGQRSFQDVCAEYGRDPSVVLKEIAEFNKMVDEMGVVLDSDPRKVTMAGVMQKLMTDGAAGGDAPPQGN